jgi:hypothetical protein
MKLRYKPNSQEWPAINKGLDRLVQDECWSLAYRNVERKISNPTDLKVSVMILVNAEFGIITRFF